MNEVLLLLFFFVILAGVILLVFVRNREKQIGSLRGKILYQDTQSHPGKTLIARSLMLGGKPDYILKTDTSIVPVEIKTGKTPRNPYLIHTMQLMAYCYIAHEAFGIRPQGGILKYPHKEFSLAYTKEAEESVRKIVKEIQKAKEDRIEFHCHHTEHNDKFYN